METITDTQAPKVKLPLPNVFEIVDFKDSIAQLQRAKVEAVHALEEAIATQCKTWQTYNFGTAETPRFVPQNEDEVLNINVQCKVIIRQHFESISYSNHTSETLHGLLILHNNTSEYLNQSMQLDLISASHDFLLINQDESIRELINKQPNIGKTEAL